MVVFDLEANGFKEYATVIWIGVAYDTVNREWVIGTDYWEEMGEPSVSCQKLDLIDFLKWLKKQPKIIAHNSLGYDYPLIRKLYPKWDHNGVEDSLVLDCMFRPDEPHSIGDHGERFGIEKPEHEDWTKPTPEMMHRCVEDVKINVKLWQELKEFRKNHDWEKAIWLEYQTAKLIGQQELDGVYLDIEEAESLLKKITTDKEVLEKEILETIPPTISSMDKGLKAGYFNKPFTQAGEYTQHCINYWGDRVEEVWGPHTRVSIDPINLNSPQQIKEYLYTQGWVPDEWNYKREGKRILKDENGEPIKMSPKLTESSYASLKTDIGKKIARFYILKHRMSILKHTTREGKKTGWLNNVRPDSRLSAGGIVVGTPTSRLRHTVVVNVPKPTKEKETGELVWDIEKQDALYGTQLRNLLKATPGRIMVGADASGLEARILAHYVYHLPGGREFADELLHGDIHAKNAGLWQCTRDEAKSPYYGLLYGAQVPKFAETLGIDLKTGEKYFEAFWENSPALKALKERTEKVWKNRGGRKGGYVFGVDGRKLFIRSPHAIINTLCQNAGSVTVKLASVLCNREVRKRLLDAFQVIHYHDEFEYDSSKKDSEEVSHVLEKSFEASGKKLGINVPIVGKAVISGTWASVH